MESLNQNDIQLLCNYFRECLPDLERRSRALDFEVTERLTNWLLAQGMKVGDIVQKRTRLTKLICHYVDTKSLAEGGKLLPKPVSVDSNEYRKRASSQSPTGSGSGMDVRPLSHTISPEQQGPIPIYHALQSQQPYRAADTCTNTAKRRRVSGNEGLQTPSVFSVPMLESNGSTAQAEDQHCSTDIPNHPGQQHNSTPIERRNVSPTFHIESENSLTGREANGAAGSKNKGTIHTNTTANHDALPGPSTVTTVDGLRCGITDNISIGDSTGNFMQPINEHSSSESSLLDRACEQRLPSPTPTYTSTLNHIELDSGTVITPKPNMFGRIGDECSKGFESSAPIRLSDYIDPEMVEDIREWETVWAPEET
jgi:hypothetical protein